jgi:hypothetical protein
VWDPTGRYAIAYAVKARCFQHHTALLRKPAANGVRCAKVELVAIDKHSHRRCCDERKKERDVRKSYFQVEHARLHVKTSETSMTSQADIRR